MLVRGAQALTKAVTKAAAKRSKVSAKRAEVEDEDELLEDEDEETVSETETDEEDEAASEEDEDEASEDEEEDLAEEDEDEEPKAKAKRAKASGERGRIAAILDSPHARGRSRLAKHLALSTGLSAKAAIGILKAAPKAASAAGKRASGSNAFDVAMRAAGNPKVGTGRAVSATAEDEAASRITAAAKLIGLA